MKPTSLESIAWLKYVVVVPKKACTSVSNSKAMASNDAGLRLLMYDRLAADS